MKTAFDPRHKRRQQLIQELFSIEFHKQKITKETQAIVDQELFLDEQIQKAAPEYPVNKINRVDLAILRLATYEMLIEKKAPNTVIIDEAVELAKEFANESSPSFVNGVLGNIAKRKQK